MLGFFILIVIYNANFSPKRFRPNFDFCNFKYNY